MKRSPRRWNLKQLQEPSEEPDSLETPSKPPKTPLLKSLREIPALSATPKTPTTKRHSQKRVAQQPETAVPHPVTPASQLPKSTQAHTGSPRSSKHLSRRSSKVPTGNMNPFAQHLDTLRHEQCTHLTVTRLFTDEFRCAVCFQFGQYGWLYRCTQDQELLLEDDRHHGTFRRMDDLGDIFERNEPSKGSPSARRYSLSFLLETPDSQLKELSSEQLTKILEQRAQVHEAISNTVAPDPSITPNNYLFNLPAGRSHNTPTERASDRADLKDKKPWIPLRGGECQFKICPRCRPSYSERSFLPLDAIVNNDIPLTAISGFGFHLLGARPVSRASVAANLGLRPNPAPHAQPSSLLSTPELHPNNQQENNLIPAQKINIRPIAIPHKATDLGLGIFPTENENRTQNQHISSPPTSPSIPIPTLPNSTLKTASPIPPPPPPPPPNNSDKDAAPLTPMEQQEAATGKFGSLPLRVGGGVAVMEESVQEHLVDVEI